MGAQGKGSGTVQCFAADRYGKEHGNTAADFGRIEPNAVIVAPFYCDKGSQIRIGRQFYANTGLIILDEADVTIGDYVFLGPRVNIYTACHPGRKNILKPTNMYYVIRSTNKVVLDGPAETF